MAAKLKRVNDILFLINGHSLQITGVMDEKPEMLFGAVSQSAMPGFSSGYTLYPGAYRGAVSIRQPFGQRTAGQHTGIP